MPNPCRPEAVEVVRGPDAGDVYAADLGCYPPPYQATREKIERLCAGFPSGVRLYRARVDGVWHIAGYSAWHPFDPALLDAPWPLHVPITTHRESAYLFNYSVTPSWIGSELARDLMVTLDRDIRGRRVLAADTVSPDGVRAARRWGMKLHEARLVDGAPWELWARVC